LRHPVRTASLGETQDAANAKNVAIRIQVQMILISNAHSASVSINVFETKMLKVLWVAFSAIFAVPKR